VTLINLRDLPRRNPKSARSYILPPNTVLIDRRSRWGNPYRIGMMSNDPDGAMPYCREDVMFLYRHYLRDRLRDNPLFLEPLRGKTLACWCPPEPCHGDVILERLASR
jgi:hypothetical protein